MAIFTSAADDVNGESGARASRIDYLLMYEVNRRNGCPFPEWFLLLALVFLRLYFICSFLSSPSSVAFPFNFPRFHSILLQFALRSLSRNHFFL